MTKYTLSKETSIENYINSRKEYGRVGAIPTYGRGLGLVCRLYFLRVLGEKRMAEGIKGLEMLIPHNNKRFNN